STLTTDDRIECDVVIVGSGAGGAALAYQLVNAGLAVVVLEGGKYLKRRDFGGRPAHLAARAYVDKGLSFSIGNLGAPIWAGRTVGGSTTINSGTCYRAPDRVLRSWQDRGLSMLGPDALSPYYERVESMLQVEPAQSDQLGVVASIVARGAERMGLSHGPLDRNAPGCDGQGQCCFGCPTGAKRSADVSWIPEALKRGVMLYASTQVERIETEGGRADGRRAVGLVARTAGGARLAVRARATVIAGGALLTPVLLEQSELCRGSGWLGRNLSIHPAGKVLGLFDERVDQWRGIPQSYTIDQFKDEGLLFEGGSTPFSVTAVALPFFGPRFMEAMERYPHLANFGFMIEDTSRGRVRRRPGGGPLITYNLNDRDTLRMKRGLEVLSEVFLRAGARAVFPGIIGLDELRSEADLARMRAMKLPADRLEVTAFHPLGTARMGIDAAESVVGPDHETHDVRDLFVVDGSVMPGPLGVNPQMTIMAMALRAGDVLARRLS
ncbi:MAG: GMC family oxidoreductase, partial [Deltaproteobacteria bacterium]|nr:GMC family oxidoreductase [Deltaproteobacteria bacterium]